MHNLHGQATQADTGHGAQRVDIRDDIASLALRGPVGDEHQHMARAQVLGDILQKPHRWTVGPVEVVDDHQQTGSRAGRAEEAPEGVEQSETIVISRGWPASRGRRDPEAIR